MQVAGTSWLPSGHDVKGELRMVAPTGFPALTSDNVALVIIDMQGDFLDEGAPCFLPGGRSVLPSLLPVLAECRKAALPVVHVRTVWQPDGIDRSLFTTSDILQERGLRFGEAGTEIIAELSPLPGEYVVDKTRYSGFFQTNLESLLRSLKVTYLLFAGVATNFCVRSTVQDACYRDFFSVVLDDCTTTFTEAAHQQTLTDIDMGFGMSASAEHIIQVIRGQEALA
jgi:nicotinamidase-related amidase